MDIDNNKMELDTEQEGKLQRLREQREKLEMQLLRLQRESIIPASKRSQKLVDLETQITDYRERIRQQQIELIKPLPKFDDSILQQRDITKRLYYEMARERLTIVKHPQLDTLDGRYIKEFDKLEYIRKAYFPLFNEKQSTLLGFSQAEDCGLRYHLQNELEQSIKLQDSNSELRRSIEQLGKELESMERQLSEP